MESVEPASKHQHLSHNMLQAKANIGAARRDFQDSTTSVSTLPSSTTDERLQRHVLKIDICPDSPKKTLKCLLRNTVSIMSISQEQLATTMGQKPFEGNLSDDQKLVLSVTETGTTCCIRNKNEVKLSNGNMRGKSFNGKCSDDELIPKVISNDIDSGTCSDAEPPALPPKMNRKKQHVLSESFCSDTSSASSSDSAQNNEHLMSDNPLMSPNLIRSIHKVAKTDPIALLPTSLLIDIRNRSVDFRESLDQDKSSSDEQDEQESNCSDLELCNRNSIEEKLMNYYSDDSFYRFHINENLSYELDAYKMTHDESDESFAGLKDLRSGSSSTIRSKNGTIRGIKNRVRSGISTFLQMQQTTVKVNQVRDSRCRATWGALFC